MPIYPSSIISFPTHVNGQVIDANDVNSPDNEITALETKVGVDNSAVSTTLDYIAKNPASNGGGHVQTAPTGGTGQTTYNKGDLLVGINSSTLGKQAAGTDGNAIVYDSTQSTGLNNSPVLTAKVIQNQTATYAPASVLSSSVYGVQITPIPSVLVAGQAFTVKWPTTNTTSVLALSVSSLIAAPIKNQDGTNPVLGAIQSSMISTVEFDGTNFQLQKDYVPTYPNDATKFLRGDGVWSSILGNSVTLNFTPGSTTSVVGYAHGLGRIPVNVEAYGVGDTNGATNNVSWCYGNYSNGSQSGIYSWGAGSNTTGISASAAINLYRINTTAGSIVGTILQPDANTVQVSWASGTNGAGLSVLLRCS